MKRIVVIVGTAALAAGVGFGAAAAAAADPSPGPSIANRSATDGPTTDGPTTGRPPAPGAPGPHLRGFAGGLPAPGQMLHGEAVTKDANGVLKTLDWQNGEVTAVSGSSVTVRSGDGTTWTWTLNGDTKVVKEGKDASASDIATGDKVAVAGQRAGDTRTASVVAGPPPDLSKLRQRMDDMRKGLPHLRKELGRDLPSPPA
jgi:hypothetical protein